MRGLLGGCTVELAWLSFCDFLRVFALAAFAPLVLPVPFACVGDKLRAVIIAFPLVVLGRVIASLLGPSFIVRLIFGVI
jgi:hypothetical protein